MARTGDIVEPLDAAIFIHPKVYEASGRVSGFCGPIVDGKASEACVCASRLTAT